MTSARSAAPASAGAVDETGPDLAAIRELPFERALEQLEGIVRSLEKGDVPLDESVAIYERGEALKRHCDALLQRAEARIQKITLGADGRAAGTAPLDVD
jgi:exodeoxyribonuclease VII small subunit